MFIDFETWCQRYGRFMKTEEGKRLAYYIAEEGNLEILWDLFRCEQVRRLMPRTDSKV
jgi:hypothetical protein